MNMRKINNISYKKGLAGIPKTRKDLAHAIERAATEIVNMFMVKNTDYGQSDDAFANFRKTSLRVFGNDDTDSMFKVLMVYMDKHLVALSHTGLNGKEARSRLLDVAVYCLIAMAMKAERNA